MKVDYINLKELRAKYLTESVTFTFSEEPSAFSGNNSADVNNFNPIGPDLMSSAQILCYREPDKSTIDAFYSVDNMMKFYMGFNLPLIMVYPIQEMMQDPYDEEEYNSIYGIAKEWSEQTGAKIVLILDTSNSFPYYPKLSY